jgi:hypothetical protein
MDELYQGLLCYLTDETSKSIWKIRWSRRKRDLLESCSFVLCSVFSVLKKTIFFILNLNTNSDVC